MEQGYDGFRFVPAIFVLSRRISWRALTTIRIELIFGGRGRKLWSKKADGPRNGITSESALVVAGIARFLDLGDMLSPGSRFASPHSFPNIFRLRLGAAVPRSLSY